MNLLHSLRIVCFILGISCFAGCNHQTGENESTLLFQQGCYPFACLEDGSYYFTMQCPSGDTIAIWKTDELEHLAQGEHRTVITSRESGLEHIWAPELHRIDGVWYLYFEADNGNTDTHQLYVMACSDEDPMKGKFEMKGAIKTSEEWNFGLHPTVLQVNRQLYLFWSGWPKRRAETETQCIYIARMENPWTTSSERVLLSQPEYEWERQWINPDGNRSAYPIYVNENPQAFLSPDGRRVFVCYSASGIWSVYTSLGMLSASSTSDLTDPHSWTKASEPLISPDSVTGIAISNICVVPSSNGQQTLLLYEAKQRTEQGEIRQIRLRPMGWTAEGAPRF